MVKRAALALLACLIGFGAAVAAPDVAYASGYTSTPSIGYQPDATWGVPFCNPRASAQANYDIWTNRHYIAVAAWYTGCRASKYKGVCARLWRYQNILPGAVFCTPTMTGYTDYYQSWKYTCTPGTVINLEMMFMVASTGAGLDYHDGSSTITC